MIALLLAAVSGAADPAQAAATPETEVEFEASIDDATPEEAWARPGFRLGLGYAFEGLFGVGGAPGGYDHSATIRGGARLDDDWSLLGGLRYGVIPGERPGLRFGGTVEPTLHLTDALTISAGIGIGGFVLPDTGAPSSPPPGGGVVASYTYTTTAPLIGACTGAGVLATLRIEYLFVIGPIFSTGPVASVDAQWTRCIDPLGDTDPDTGEGLELRQFWHHHALSVGWTFWWR